MKVKLVKAYGAELLEKAVNEHLAQGWHLTGNPFAGKDGALYWPIAYVEPQKRFRFKDAAFEVKEKS
jgi:hypothetical protein